MHGSDRAPDLKRLQASLGWQSKSNRFNESEMALFYECMLKCARKLLDTADIVRDAMLRQLTLGAAATPQDQRTRSSTRRQVLPSPISSRSPSSLKGRGWSVSVKSGAKLPST